METDWKKLRKEAGFESTAEVAQLMDCGISTINGLENHGKAGRVFKRRLLALYESRTHAADKISETESDYAFREIATGDITQDLELWKRRAKEAEKKLEYLRNLLRSALELSSTTPVAGADRISSKPPSDAQAAAAQASASATTDPSE